MFGGVPGQGQGGGGGKQQTSSGTDHVRILRQGRAKDLAIL